MFFTHWTSGSLVVSKVMAQKGQSMSEVERGQSYQFCWILGSPPFWEIYIYTHLHIDAHICKNILSIDTILDLHIYIYVNICIIYLYVFPHIPQTAGLLWPGHPNLVELLGRRPSRGDWFSWIPMRLQWLDNLWLVVWEDMLRNKMGWIFAGWWFGRRILFFHLLGMSSSQLTNSYFSEG
jgi:hypothetical protein